MASLSFALAVVLAAGTAVLLTGIGPAGAFTPGEGTGRSWCHGYGGSSRGSYGDVYACTPDSKTAGKTPFDTYPGFQPTELANRFLFAVTGHTLFDNDVAGNFVALASASFAIPDATAGPSAGLPAAGDIVSMWGGRSKQKENGDRTQVAIVTAVTRNGTGWTITTLNQSDPSDTDGANGFNTIAVSASLTTWSAEDGFYADFAWLRLARRAGPPPHRGWLAAEAPRLGSVATGALAAVACGSPASCTAVGTSGNSAMLIAQNGSRWRAVGVPQPASSITSSILTAVACPSASGCVAVGSYRSSGHQQGFLLAGHGSSWTATTAPLPGDAALSPAVRLASVACVTSFTCVAVGQYANGTSQDALLVTGHGSAWSGRPAPLPADAGSRPAAGLLAIACPAPASCTAAGSYVDNLGNRQGMLVMLHGAAWTAIRSPLPQAATVPGAQLEAVACPRVTSCVAVGSYSAGSQGFVVSGTGTRWKAWPAPMPAGAAADPAASFRSIACAASTCVAVGSYADGSGNRLGLLVSGRASTLTAVSVPLPSGAAPAQGNPGTQLTSVACPARTGCVAVGVYTDTTGDAQMLLLAGAGSSWQPARAPIPANARTVGSQAQGTLAPPVLAWVACPAISACVAVGSYPARRAGMEGLIVTGRA